MSKQEKLKKKQRQELREQQKQGKEEVAEKPVPAVESETPVSKVEMGCVLSVLAYFCVKVGYFAMHIRDNIFPDEITHFGRVQLFSKSFWSPVDSPDSYPLGLVTHVPTLYYALMGKLMHLNVFGFSDLVFLRFLNLLIGVVSVVFAWKLVRLVAARPAVRVLFVVLFTNTLMFTFLSASVNYDVLTNCFAVISLYYLTRYLKNGQVGHLMLFLVFLMAGTLTKLPFLPYAVCLVAILLFKKRKVLLATLSETGVYLKRLAPGRIVLAVVFVLLLFSNLKLYGVNLVKYGSVRPKVDQILTLEQAMQNRIFARNRVLRLFRAGEINLREAENMAAQIPHAGDRQGALIMLRRAASEKNTTPRRMTRFQYSADWLELSLGKSFGIMGHKSMEKRGHQLMPYMVILLVAMGLMIRKMKAEDLCGMGGAFLFMVIVYGLVLLLKVNYPSYYKTGLLDVALQGRYLFPVLAPFYVLVAYYLLKGLGEKRQWIVCAIIGGFFIYGEFPFFLKNVTPQWLF